MTAMLSRRFFLRAAILAAALSPFRAALAQTASGAAAAAPATIQAFYDALLQAMKGGKQLGFNGRRELLAPAVQRAYDLPLMARLTIGPSWAALSPDDQKRFIQAFSDFSIATYASRFDDYSGERFEVTPQPSPASGGDVIVRTKLVPSDGKPVQLDYLMRPEGGGWRVIDVYLSGTISELASRRSEYSTVLRRDGAPALINLLRQKTAQLAS